MHYVGRFAPSPTGPLHAGSLAAALASWLDARAQGGQWRVRFEDIDRPRCVQGADGLILEQLARCGLYPDGPVIWQSQRDHVYQAALDRLIAGGFAYPCSCSRRDIEAALAAAGRAHNRFGELVYPGTCRDGSGAKPARALRLRTAIGGHEVVVEWADRRLGVRHQNLSSEVGDFVLLRADGAWAYQLAVVVDDAETGISDVVRGEDLADNTPRQIYLQRCLALPTPRYLHTPLVLGRDGHKLSKQNGAKAVDLRDPCRAIVAACAALELGPLPVAAPLGDVLHTAVRAWASRWAVA